MFRPYLELGNSEFDDPKRFEKLTQKPTTFVNNSLQDSAFNYLKTVSEVKVDFLGTNL